MATLNTDPNIAVPDDFYERLIATHRGLSDEQSALVARRARQPQLQGHVGHRRAPVRKCRSAFGFPTGSPAH